MRILIIRFALWLLKITRWEKTGLVTVTAHAEIDISDLVSMRISTAREEVRKRICFSIGEEIFSLGLMRTMVCSDDKFPDRRRYKATVCILPPCGRRPRWIL